MVDSEHPARRERHRANVHRLLDAAGIRLSDLDVTPNEVSASVTITTAYLGERARGEVLVSRRSPGHEADLWHASMGDKDCLDLAELVEMTLRGLGYHCSRDNAVPNMVRFTCDVGASLDVADTLHAFAE